MERVVPYWRHEFRFDPEPREAPLWAFLFDIPYFPACDVFPPRHILNSRLRSGGGDGGMSPGASWEPFEISNEEYAEILPKVLNPDQDMLRRFARYPERKFEIDPAFDHHTDYFAWYAAVCDKHRTAFHAKMQGK